MGRALIQRACVLVALIASSTLVSASGASAAKLPDACKVLTSADTAAAFPSGTLAPGPSPDTAIGGGTGNFCRWSGQVSAPAQYIVSGGVRIYKVPKGSKLSATSEGTTPLTKQELKGIGADSGYVWISPTSGGSGSITVSKGTTRISINAGHSGVVPVPKVDRAAFIGLATKVAKQA